MEHDEMSDSLEQPSATPEPKGCTCRPQYNCDALLIGNYHRHRLDCISITHCQHCLSLESDNERLKCELVTWEGARAHIRVRDERIASLETALAEARRVIDEAIAVLEPNMPESGLIDACRQVKQFAMTAEGNCNTLEAQIESLKALVHTLEGQALAQEGGLSRQLREIESLKGEVARLRQFEPATKEHLKALQQELAGLKGEKP